MCSSSNFVPLESIKSDVIKFVADNRSLHPRTLLRAPYRTALQLTATLIAPWTSISNKHRRLITFNAFCLIYTAIRSQRAQSNSRIGKSFSRKRDFQSGQKISKKLFMACMVFERAITCRISFWLASVNEYSVRQISRRLSVSMYVNVYVLP